MDPISFTLAAWILGILGTRADSARREKPKDQAQSVTAKIRMTALGFLVILTALTIMGIPVRI